MSTLTGALIRNRILSSRHYFRALESSERVRLAVIVCLISAVLIYWSLGITDRPLRMEDPSALRAAIRVEAYRIGAFLSGLVGFISFGGLWRSADTEVLNRLPVPPRAIFRYRLVMVILGTFPLFALSWVGFLPLLWKGHPYLAIEALIYLLTVYLSTALWSIRWHVFAGYSVVTPSYARIKTMLAGAMVLSDRTLLLYSPFLGAVSGFLMGLAVLSGLSALTRGQIWLGVPLVLVPILPNRWAWRNAISLFESWYYQALSALADGELLGEISESAPGPEYLGAWWVARLPQPLRPLVARDLLQAWRRSRVDHMLLLTATGIFMVVMAARRPPTAEEIWFWPVVWALLTAAGAQSFRLTRPSSDSPWQWISLQVPLYRQYLGRFFSVLFFPMMISPGLVLGCRWAGVPWLDAIGIVMLGSITTTWAATNIGLFFFTQRGLGGILFLCIMAASLGGGQGDPWMGGAWLACLAATTGLSLRSLGTRMAMFEQGRRE